MYRHVWVRIHVGWKSCLGEGNTLETARRGVERGGNRRRSVAVRRGGQWRTENGTMSWRTPRTCSWQFVSLYLSATSNWSVNFLILDVVKTKECLQRREDSCESHADFRLIASDPTCYAMIERVSARERPDGLGGSTLGGRWLPYLRGSQCSRSPGWKWKDWNELEAVNLHFMSHLLQFVSDVDKLFRRVRVADDLIDQEPIDDHLQNFKIVLFWHQQ